MRRLVWILILGAQTAGASSVGAFFKNEEGVAKFRAKSYYPAYQLFLKGLEEEPLSPELQLNIGRTFENNEEFEKAASAYIGALKLIALGSSLRFEALFNLGGVLGKLKRFDEALAAYQEALEIEPESKEVKTNIELLWQNGGGGGGSDKDKNDQDKDGKNQQQQQKPKDGDNKDQKQDPQPDQQKEQKKQQPKPFQSKELDQQDVKKILDEIKNQEQSIRAQEYERNVKDAPRAKDW